VTVREQSMLGVMEALTNKPEWRRKVFDEAIVAKWGSEVVDNDPDGRNFTDDMFDYCIAELRNKAKQHEDTGIVRVLDIVASVVKSDELVPEELRLKLIEAVKLLENVPEKQKDWHPGSDEKVLDLVHPSLFPLIYGVSRVFPTEAEKVGVQDCMKRCGEGEVIRAPKGQFGDYNGFISRRFQWLPSEVSFQAGGKVKFESYVNNLHPTHDAPLYPILEEIVALAIPLWNETLSSVTHTHNQQRLRIRIDHIEYDWPNGEWDDHEPAEDEPDEEDRDAYYDYREEWMRNNRILAYPEPETYDEDLKHFAANPPPPAVDLRKQIPNGVQVIVKLANIHLTPEKPEYEGGSWHVEGFVNEHICATALYYYDCENITDSHLGFRQYTDTIDMSGKSYGQDDNEGVEVVYGIENESPSVQPVGRILARQSRFLAFPNIFQHRVAPFRLQDRTKPGHRKIVALFLIDPYVKVISTANVPPQQRDWWAEELLKNGGIGDLPAELVGQVVNDVDDFPVSLEKAKELREELMEER
ncbi:hypothetical protein P152DRAFT_383276, partial [Eremomyces bilateralis CBS 781.70]